VNLPGMTEAGNVPNGRLRIWDLGIRIADLTGSGIHRRAKNAAVEMDMLCSRYVLLKKR
jgi:hypothetical protein